MLRVCARSVAAVVLLTAAAPAHPILHGSVWVSPSRDKILVRARVTLREPAVTAGLLPGEDGKLRPEDLRRAIEKHRPYFLSHFQVRADGRTLEGKVLHAEAEEAIQRPIYALELEKFHVLLAVEYPLGAAPASLSFEQDALKEFTYAPGAYWDVTYLLRIQGERGELHATLRRGENPFEYETGWDRAPSAGGPAPRQAGFHEEGSFGAYLIHGIEHILTGYDHLLFMAAMALGVASFWRLFALVGAFTLAHSVTLTLSVLDLVRLPSAIVELVIALSIIGVAVENVFWPERAAKGGRLAMAFAFGLFHGLGFAGGLLDAMQGLPGMAVGTAVAAFSLGVEAGHQLVVLPLFGALWLYRRRQEGNPQAALSLPRYASLVISLGGIYFFWLAI